MAQTGSVQWYKDMAGKLKVVTAELHVGRINLLYGINVGDRNAINNAITKAINRLNENYKKTINAFWNASGCNHWREAKEFTAKDIEDIAKVWSDKPNKEVKFDMNGLWREFNEALGKPWENPLKQMYIGGVDPVVKSSESNRLAYVEQDFTITIEEAEKMLSKVGVESLRIQGSAESDYEKVKQMLKNNFKK